MILKKLELKGTEQQIENLILLMAHGDNDLPNIVSLSTEEIVEDNIFTNSSYLVKGSCFKEWTIVSSFLASGLQGVSIIKFK